MEKEFIKIYATCPWKKSKIWLETIFKIFVYIKKIDNTFVTHRIRVTQIPSLDLSILKF